MLTKIINNFRSHKFLYSIVLIGFVLRINNVSNNPPSLNWDEVSHGYNAYSILETGKDEWGETFPLIFRAYGDYKLPVYIYTTVISIALFGINTFAIRLPSVLAGTGTVIFVYLLVLEFGRMGMLGKKQIKNIALLSALLVSIEPWSLFLSRGAFEANLALFLFTAAVYFLFRSFEDTKHIITSSLLFGLTVWTYNSYRVFTPLMLFSLLVLFRGEVVKLYKSSSKHFFYSVFILAIFFVPMFWQFATGTGQARYEKVAILDQGAINKINEQRNLSEYNPTIARFLYNRPVHFAKTAANNWLQHFSPNFLFLKGGDQYQYSVQEHGLIYLINLPFFILGILFLFRESLSSKQKYAALLLLWIILAPIPASITRDSPHALRTITILPMPMIVTALGVLVFSQRFIRIKETQKKSFSSYVNIYAMFYLVILSILFSNYWIKYTQKYREDYSWSWQYGYEQTISYVKNNYNKHEKIIFTKKYGEPHIFLLFHWPWDPDKYRNDPNLIRFEQSDWFWVDRFDKFYFVNDWEIPTRSDHDFVLESGEEFDCDHSSCLLITSPGTVQQDWDLLETIYFLDGKSAFEIYDNRK